MPEPWRRSSIPAWTRAWTASLMVLREVPVSSHNSGSVGMRAPIAQRPDTISSRSCSVTWPINVWRRTGCMTAHRSVHRKSA
ncbi:Uncharacterised protein [Mycobacteroides abscessus subsp. abscessus]|nr:Uncharacterised protein [Mycobacteroides abscessus subsp. abscessus]